MGLIRTEIQLVNSVDAGLVSRGYLKKEEIRQTNVTALVDSGAYMLCINEVLKTQPGLEVVEVSSATLANDNVETYEIVGPVTVRFKNRMTICRALVLPGSNEVLLGAIPLEDMDVVINPKTQTLELHPDHPYMANTILKGIK
jgi:clan AA aspartic protease